MKKVILQKQIIYFLGIFYFSNLQYRIKGLFLSGTSKDINLTKISKVHFLCPVSIKKKVTQINNLFNSVCIICLFTNTSLSKSDVLLEIYLWVMEEKSIISTRELFSKGGIFNPRFLVFHASLKNIIIILNKQSCLNIRIVLFCFNVELLHLLYLIIKVVTLVEW